MRHHRLLGATAIAAALVFAGSAAAQERVFFGIATGGTGGTYYPLGGMLAQLISKARTALDAQTSLEACEASSKAITGSESRAECG